MPNHVKLSPVDRELVINAYRLLLGCEPESEAVIEQWISDCETLDELRNSFLCSAEFSEQVVPQFLHRRFPFDGSREYKIGVTGTREQLDALFDRVSESWRHLGQTEPYWSVISAEKFKRAEFERHRREFYKSGGADVDRMVIWMERNGLFTRPGQSCLEYGCGAGRITSHLATRFVTTHAYDISKPHLRLAEEAIGEAGLKARVIFHLVESPHSLIELPPADLVFSILVLQHNPPPVIAYILDKLLGSLRKGGVAFFQVPTFRERYSFDIEEYLKVPLPKEPEMEMHVLPQRHVFEIINRNNCRVMEVQPDNLTGSIDFVSNTFLVLKT
jgi:SAM-dependent methyltransferase